MRILVTGGFGFLGGRVGCALREAGHEVIFGARNPDLAHGGVDWGEVAKTEWENVGALEAVLRGVNVVVHAAGMNAGDCVKDPVEALAFNGVATARLAGAAVRAGVSKLVYFSTAHIYASPLVGEITEAVLPQNLHPYATTHLAGEMAVRGATKGTETEAIILRLSNVFGSPVHPAANCWMLLVNDLCKQALTDGRMVLRTGGRQMRDFLPMRDFLRVVVALVDGGKGVDGGVYNLGSGKSERVLEMAERIQRRAWEVLGKEVSIVRPEEGGEVEESLFYGVSAIEGTGYGAGLGQEETAVEEIDDLLRYCGEVFGEKGGVA